MSRSRRKRALRRETDPPPDMSASRAVVLPTQRQAGVRVDEATALTLGAVFACVRVIAETLASLPWGVFEALAGGGRRPVPEDPADWLLKMQANPETSAFQWREATTAHALTWGNGYSEIERDLAARPVWLWQLTPERVEVVRFRGRLIYDVAEPGGPNTPLEAADVFHTRGLGYDGLVGYPVIRMFARTIGLGISLEESASTMFANDSTPGGLLKHPGRLSDKGRDNLRDTWQRMHGGPTRRRTVAILEEGMDWQQTGLPPEDAQLVEQRQLTPAEICRIFRVPPHKIADLSRSTNNNIEWQGREFWTDTLMPWASRLESEANLKLFGRTNRGRRQTRINFKTLLRGDSQARATYYHSMLSDGVFSVNDVREEEDMNPIGPEGDIRLVPLNMQPLSLADQGQADAPAELLDVPDVPQRTGYDCGVAATASLLDFFALPYDYAELQVELETTPAAGTEVEDIVALLIRRGLSVTTGSELDADDLRAFFAAGRPVLCPVQDYGTPALERTGRSGHYVIVVGVGMGQLILRDPAFSWLVTSTGDVSSSHRVVSEEDFLADWHDIAADGTPYVRFGVAVGEEVLIEAPEPEPPEPAPAKGAPPPQANGQAAPQKPAPAYQAAFGPLLAEAFSRVLKRLEGARPGQGRDSEPAHRAFALAALLPPARALAVSAGGSQRGAEVAVVLFLDDHPLAAFQNQTAQALAADLVGGVLASCPTLPAPPPPVAPPPSLTLNFAAQPPADVRVENRFLVPPALPPAVHLQNLVEVPPAPPPEVRVENRVEVPPAPPPAVTVNVPAQPPPEVRVEAPVHVEVPAALPPAVVNQITIPDPDVEVTIERDAKTGLAKGLRRRPKKKGGET